jgi:hypothetical protein
MGKPATLLEGLSGHALSFGAKSIAVETGDGRELVFAHIDGENIRIANYADSSADGKELLRDLAAAAKKSVRTVIGGQVFILKVSRLDGAGGVTFEVAIDPAPKLDPSIPPPFTAKQGQYLAFIYHYTKINRRAPAETDLQRYFRVSAPSINAMVKTLERNGFIERTPGQGRSIRLVVRPEHLPVLE